MEIDSLVQYKSRALSMRRLLLGKAKLKASSRTSALLSGFAMVAMVEIQLGSTLPQSILVTFSIITTLVVALHLLALMISTCILPHLEAVSEMQTLALIHDSPHDHFYWYIEIAWFLSTGIGIFLFLAQMAMLAWVRFYDLSQASHIASTAIIVPVIVIFVAFAVHFHRKLITAKCHTSTRGIVELEQLALDLDSTHVANDNTDNNHYASNLSSDAHLFNNKQYNNTYNITLDHLSYPQQHNIMLQNGIDAVFKPINPLYNTPSKTPSKHQTHVMDVTLPTSQPSDGKGHAMATTDSKTSTTSNKSHSQNTTKESRQFISMPENAAKTHGMKEKTMFSKLFAKKQPSHTTTLDL